MQTIRGASYDQRNRPLHCIEKVAAGGRIEFAYRYGDVPDDSKAAGAASESAAGQQ